jgi:low temperature requirement protein LtrA
VEPATLSEDEVRVPSIELFFDLVFVFTITQLTHLVEEAHDAVGFLRALLVLTLVWWIYAGYSWLTNDAGAGRQMRLVLLAGMGGFLVIALSIPTVFGDGGLTFGLAYLFVIVLHLFAFVLKAGRRSARAVFGLAPFNLGAAALVIAAGLVDAAWDWLFLLAAAGLYVTSTIPRRHDGFSINASHFAERHGLIILIALGESVVAIGSGAAEHPIDAASLTPVLLALLLIAALWWSYFDEDDERAERLLVAAPPEARPGIAVFGYWYGHLAMIFGIVLLASGVKHVVARGTEPVHGAAWLLASGTAIYLLGDVLFRSVIGLRPVLVRVLGAVAALGLGAVGLAWGGVAELGALAAMALVVLALERRLARGDRVSQGPR